MLIIENPLRLLIIALGIMICLLLFFKFMDFTDKIKSKAKGSKKAESSEKKSEDKKSEEVLEEDIPFDSNNMTNYLYDRFVLSPTTDDAICYKANISDSFLTEEKYSEIRNKKVKIEVKPVENSVYSNQVHSKIAELTNNNRQEKH